MKKNILVLFVLFFGGLKVDAQNILVVNDNDNITLNTDTLLDALNHTIYNSYDYWSVPDSAGVAPSAAVLNAYQLVIWYASTDGVDLSMWGGTNAGDTNLVNYIQTGKPLWIIGQDILYDRYPTYGAFGMGDFAYDYMGLETYNVQSYVDDGNLGVSVLEKLPDAPSTFLSNINWTFSTLWYVDGCDATPGTYLMYKMGPASYSLAGQVCMFHKKTSAQSVMSTLFDPALMNTQANRIVFLETGITYLLNSTVGMTSIDKDDVICWPNPAVNKIMIQSKNQQIQEVKLINLNGDIVQHKKLNNVNQLDYSLCGLPAGTYHLQLIFANGTYYSRLIQVQ